MSTSLFNLTEKQLVEESEKIFINKGYLTYKEVPLFSSSVDMILVKDDKIFAVEFKKRDWKKALQQVLRHSICVDYLCICVPKFKKRDTREKVERVLLENGVGLYYLYYEENGSPYIEEKIIPKETTYVWKKKRNDLLEKLKD